MSMLRAMQPTARGRPPYVPNKIPASERNTSIALSVLLFAYGTYGVWRNDLYLPSKHGRGLHLHDLPAWGVYGAMLCACLVMLSVVADHYDQRDNERHYRTFATVGRGVGWFLFGGSLAYSLFHH